MPELPFPVEVFAMPEHPLDAIKLPNLCLFRNAKFRWNGKISEMESFESVRTGRSFQSLRRTIPARDRKDPLYRDDLDDGLYVLRVVSPPDLGIAASFLDGLFRRERRRESHKRIENGLTPIRLLANSQFLAELWVRYVDALMFHPAAADDFSLQLAVKDLLETKLLVMPFGATQAALDGIDSWLMK
jgi:hypothetical protein